MSLKHNGKAVKEMEGGRKEEGIYPARDFQTRGIRRKGRGVEAPTAGSDDSIQYCGLSEDMQTQEEMRWTRGRRQLSRVLTAQGCLCSASFASWMQNFICSEREHVSKSAASSPLSAYSVRMSDYSNSRG